MPGVAASVAVGRAQTPTRKRAKRFRVTPASSRTFWTDFLLSLANGLLEEDVLLEEAVDATLDDLRQGGLGLALLAGGGLGDAALVLDVSAGISSRVRYFGANAAMCCATSLATSAFALSSSTSTPTCGGRSGLVRCRYDGDEAVGELREAVQDDLLAEGGVGLVDVRLDGLAGLDLGGEQRLDVGRAGRGDVRGDRVGDGHELVALGDEVGLALQLDAGRRRCCRRR